MRVLTNMFGVCSIALLCAAAAGACSPTPSPRRLPVEMDAGGATSSDVCAHLAAIGCSTGRDPACARTLDKVVADRLTILPFGCWLAARDVAGAQSCGVAVCR